LANVIIAFSRLLLNSAPFVKFFQFKLISHKRDNPGKRFVPLNVILYVILLNAEAFAGKRFNLFRNKAVGCFRVFMATIKINP